MKDCLCKSRTIYRYQPYLSVRGLSLLPNLKTLNYQSLVKLSWHKNQKIKKSNKGMDAYEAIFQLTDKCNVGLFVPSG